MSMRKHSKNNPNTQIITAHGRQHKYSEKTINIHISDRGYVTGKLKELIMCRTVRHLVLVVYLGSAIGVGVEEASGTGHLQREKRTILLAKGLALGKGLVIGKLAGLAVG
jgi:hypothetical protein